MVRQPGVVVGKRRIQKTTTTVPLSRSGFSTAAYLDHMHTHMLSAFFLALKLKRRLVFSAKTINGALARAHFISSRLTKDKLQCALSYATNYAQARSMSCKTDDLTKRLLECLEELDNYKDDLDTWTDSLEELSENVYPIFHAHIKRCATLFVEGTKHLSASKSH